MASRQHRRASSAATCRRRALLALQESLGLISSSTSGAIFSTVSAVALIPAAASSAEEEAEEAASSAESAASEAEEATSEAEPAGEATDIEKLTIMYVPSRPAEEIISASVDGKLVTYFADAAVPDPSKPGYFGFGIFESHAEFTRLKVYRPHPTPRPLAYLPGSKVGR